VTIATLAHVDRRTMEFCRLDRSMELITNDWIRLRGWSYRMNCQRCLREVAATHRVFTDLIDMNVCAKCADEARRIGIAVEELGGSEANKSRA
jgi:hypothetical protein